MARWMTWHFKQRMKQRYGMNLTQQDAKHIVSRIRNGHLLTHGVDNDGVERCQLRFRGRVIEVVFDGVEDVLITACPAPCPPGPKLLDFVVGEPNLLSALYLN